MIKVFSTVILLFFLVPAALSHAQANTGASKIYVGYLHQNSVKKNTSLWHSLFGTKPHEQAEVLQNKQCSVEFRSPVAFSHRAVAVLPGELSYFIRFKNGGFKKFIIEIYTNDDEAYLVDPDAEGKQVGTNDEHHIFDSYLIYLILGSTIDHLEVVSSDADNKDKYVLDKLEIRDNH